MRITKKTWGCACLALLSAAVIGTSALVIAVDPFQIYRKATHFIPPIDNTTQVYANAGIARHYDYDSAIVGTSVTENFCPSQMDEFLGGRFIKLCTAAGTAYNHALLMDAAFRTRDMRRIVYGLDVYSFIGALDKTGSDMPMYLYNDNPLDDVAYWLNRSVLAGFLPRSLRTWGQTQDDTLRDTMYRWAGNDDYGTVALYNASFAPPESELPADHHIQRATDNLQTHLIPFIKAHPETRFDIFFPPYSAAEWSTMKSRGTLNAMLALRGVCYDALCCFPNVALYDFAAQADWVLDLNNYKDTLHYGEWINTAITEAIATNTCRVENRTQLDEATQKLHEWADALIDAGKWIY